MDLEELRTVQTRERATEGLQELRDSFYADVAEYIESLREARSKAAAEAEDPFREPEVTDLTDEIETAEEVAEAIYERRIGKLVKRASLAAAGMPDDTEGLTAEERDLYETLVERIEQNKTQVLETLTGDREPQTEPSSAGSGARGGSRRRGQEPASDTDAPEPPPDRPPADRTDPEPPAEGGESSAAAVMDGALGEVGSDADSTGQDDGPSEGDTDHATSEGDNGHGPSEGDTDQATSEGDQDGDPPGDVENPNVSGDGGPDAPSIDRTKVRVTEDVGEIFGVDERAYTLEADDVVHLPTENATPLIDRDAAERLE